ncbi:hypothetical protein [Dawidia soli]|uniref:Uncharacterized protein n=1 Tax=Dawidia soli TaxID=2782352 RepID=A0AAP2GG24_9BACT|nr:hypothetical protein [Dawidia soli]MBT1690079.1 hypothetical protein [Dawidia soli]
MSTFPDTQSLEHYSDKDLILAIKQGDKAAQDYAVKKYGHKILPILQTLTTRSRSLESLLKELFSLSRKLITGINNSHHLKPITILLKAADIMITTRKQNSYPAPVPAAISLYFDASQFDSTEIADIIHLLSDTYRIIGGDALVIKKMDYLDLSPVSRS